METVLTPPPLGRRGLLAVLGGGLLAAFGLSAGRARGAAGPLYVTCRADRAGRYFATGFGPDSGMRFDLPLPERGHSLAFHPTAPHCVVFARRPGRFAVVVDYAAGAALRRIDAAPGRHFYGHGTFAPDGRHLFTTENAYDSGDGVLGIRDATDGYRQIGEFPTYGIGPHEVVLLPDGQTLGIANGGIRTHPDHDRDNLNLDSMVPSLAYVDLADGKLKADYRLPERLHWLSIRHAAVLASGGLALAMQYEGSKQDQVALVGLHEGGAIRLLEAPAPVQRAMRHYAGSIAADRAGTQIAVSAPRGGLVTFWDTVAGRYLGATRIADGCGVAPTAQPGEFLLTSGAGEVVRYCPATDKRAPLALGPALAEAAWDNHLRLTDLSA
jgi:hypothetical protein